MYSQENGDEKKESFLYTLVLKVKNIKGAFKKDKGEKKYLIKDGIPCLGRKEEAEKENILSSVLTPKRRRAARVYAVGVSRVWKEFKKHIAYPAAAFLVVLSLLFVVNTMDLRLGYEVIIGGETIGLVTNKDDVYTAIKEAGEDIEKYTGEKSNIQEPAFILRVVSGKDAESAEDIKESILSNLDYMVNCYGIYIDSEPVLALTSKTAADWALSKHMEAVSGGAEEGETLDFVENAVDIAWIFPQNPAFQHQSIGFAGSIPHFSIACEPLIRFQLQKCATLWRAVDVHKAHVGDSQCRRAGTAVKILHGNNLPSRELTLFPSKILAKVSLIVESPQITLCFPKSHISPFLLKAGF